MTLRIGKAPTHLLDHAAAVLGHEGAAAVALAGVAAVRACGPAAAGGRGRPCGLFQLAPRLPAGLLMLSLTSQGIRPHHPAHCQLTPADEAPPQHLPSPNAHTPRKRARNPSSPPAQICERPRMPL